MFIYTITRHELLLQLFWWIHAIYGTLILKLRLPSLSQKILIQFIMKMIDIIQNNYQWFTYGSDGFDCLYNIDIKGICQTILLL